MIAKVQSYALSGLEGVCVTVEADISKGLPSYDMVGLPDAAVKESKERVRSAVKNSALEFPAHKITVNLAPAYVKKEGSVYDLPMAVAVLSATKQIRGDYNDAVVDIAKRCGLTQVNVKVTLHRMRNKLALHLKKEGIFV